MKILHVINSLKTAGAERIVTDLVPIMKRLGHDVEVMLLNSYNTTFEQQLSEKGIKVKSLNLWGGRFNPFTPFYLRRQLLGYDIVHAHLFPTQYWAAFAVKMLRNKPLLVTTEHNTFNTRGRYSLTTIIDKSIYGMYDGIVCISQGTKEFMQKRAPKRIVLEVIENGIDLSKFTNTQNIASREALLGKKSNKDFVVLQVARFQEQKNQDCLIKALGHLPANVHAVFAGDGKRLEECKKLAIDIGVARRAHFLGVYNDVGSLWNIADLGVMSSHWEGFGLAAIEGMTCGKPVLASNVKGLAEVVKYKELLFTPNDEIELANKILLLAKDKKLRGSMSKLCLERAMQYDINKTTEKYISFYRELLSKKRGNQIERYKMFICVKYIHGLFNLRLKV